MPFTLKEKYYAYKISASIFYKVKGMVLKGVIYIFVNPNPNSVLAFSLKSQQVLEPMDTHHYPSALNVTEMKEIVPFYAWYEHFTCQFANMFIRLGNTGSLRPLVHLRKPSICQNDPHIALGDHFGIVKAWCTMTFLQGPKDPVLPNLMFMLRERHFEFIIKISEG